MKFAAEIRSALLVDWKSVNFKLKHRRRRRFTAAGRTPRFLKQAIPAQKSRWTKRRKYLAPGSKHSRCSEDAYVTLSANAWAERVRGLVGAALLRKHAGVIQTCSKTSWQVISVPVTSAWVPTVSPILSNQPIKEQNQTRSCRHSPS